MNIFLLGNIQTNFIYNWYEAIFSHVNNISVLHARSQKIGSKQAPNFIEQIEMLEIQPVECSICYSKHSKESDGTNLTRTYP